MAILLDTTLTGTLLMYGNGMNNSKGVCFKSEEEGIDYGYFAPLKPSNMILGTEKVPWNTVYSEKYEIKNASGLYGKIDIVEGKTNQVGQTQFDIGNNKRSTMSENAKGLLNIYGKEQFKTTILAYEDLLNDTTIFLPNKDGVLALEEHTHSIPSNEYEEISSSLSDDTTLIIEKAKIWRNPENGICSFNLSLVWKPSADVDAGTVKEIPFTLSKYTPVSDTILNIYVNTTINFKSKLKTDGKLIIYPQDKLSATNTYEILISGMYFSPQ